eukprot:scpid60746/ scgid0315/ 
MATQVSFRDQQHPSSANASALVKRAHEQLKRGDYTAAKSLLAEVVEDADRHEERIAMRRQCAHSAGMCLLRLGRARDSLVHLQQAAVPSVFANSSISADHAKDGSSSTADAEMQRLAEIEHARSLHTLAIAHATLGEHDLAIPHFKKSLALFKKHQLAELEARGLLRLASSYRVTPGKLDLALKCLERSSALFARIDKSQWLAYVHALRAAVFLERGDHEEAVTQLEVALVTVQGADDVHLKCRVFTSAGASYAVLGRHVVAIECFKQSLAVSRQGLSNAQYEATLLANTATLLTVDGRYQESIAYYQKAIAALEQLHNKTSLAPVLANYAQALFMTNQLDAVKSTVQLSVGLARHDNDIATAAQCAETLAAVHNRQDNATEERRCLRAALKSLSRLNWDVSDDVDRVVAKLRALQASEDGDASAGATINLGVSQMSNLSTDLRYLAGSSTLNETHSVATKVVISPVVKSLGSLSSDSSLSLSDDDDMFRVSDLSDSDVGYGTVEGVRRANKRDKTSSSGPVAVVDPDREARVFRHLHDPNVPELTESRSSLPGTRQHQSQQSEVTASASPMTARTTKTAAVSSNPNAGANKPGPLDLTSVSNSRPEDAAAKAATAAPPKPSR